MAGSTPSQSGRTTSDDVAAIVAAAFRANSLTQSEVATRMAALGHKLHQQNFARMLSGERPIRASEYVDLMRILPGLPPLGATEADERGRELSYLREFFGLVADASEMATRVMKESRGEEEAAPR